MLLRLTQQHEERKPNDEEVNEVAPRIEFNKKDNGHYCVESYPDTILINIPPNQYEVEIFKDSIPKCQNIEKPSNIFKSLIVTTSTGDTIFKQEEYNNCLWCVYNLTHQTSYELFLDR